jgi:hypothetical protein
MTIPLVASACWVGGTPVSFAVKDVSSGGAYLVTPEKWYLGTIVTMSFRYDPAYLQVARIRGDAGASIQVRAKVLRAGAEGLGVKFVYLNKEERLRFEHFLAGAQVQEMK